MRTKADPSAIFQSVTETAKRTGLSARYLRTGCQQGQIPHIKVGSDMRINLPLYLNMLNRESCERVKDGANAY